MHRTLADSLESAPVEKVQPLPWQWFEFREPPMPAEQLVSAAPPRSAEESARQVWQVEIDGHPIPFKFFRQPQADGRRGERRPVLMLLHGMGLTIASFRGISGYLFAGHDLLLPDYSGFSGAPLFQVSLKIFALGVWRVADAAGIDRLSLAGNSLGGGLCLMATLLHPERVEKILLANPACFPQDLPRMYRMARIPIIGELLMGITAPEKFVGGVEYIGYVDKARFDPVLRGLYTGSLAQRKNRLRLMQIIRELPAGPGDNAAAGHVWRLSEIHQPVLISWGLQDPLLVTGAGERLARELPNATYDPHPDLAHMPHEEAPDRIGPEWAAFLDSKA